MSERDLPSRLLSEQIQAADPRRNMAIHAPIQSSKSVPSLSSEFVLFHIINFLYMAVIINVLNPMVITGGNNELIHTNVNQKQHEIFNPGYSRTSSTNSIPQKTYEAQHHQQAVPTQVPNGPTSSAIRSK